MLGVIYIRHYSVLPPGFELTDLIVSLREVGCHWLDLGKYYPHFEFQTAVQLFPAILARPEDVQAPAFRQLLPRWAVTKIFPPPLCLGSGQETSFRVEFSPCRDSLH